MSDGKNSLKGRPFLGVMFECCKVYVRVYQDRDGKHYNGRCPRCLRTLKFVVGEGGKASRMWRAK